MGILSGLTPDEFVESVEQIDLARLRTRGFRGLLLDLDNTLVPWMTYDVSPEVEGWLREAQSAGFGLCIVSNTRRGGRLAKIAGRLGLPFVGSGFLGMKPGRRSFFEAMRLLGLGPGECVVVGDQLFTDVWGGNRSGMYTIKVTPRATREFFGTKITRMLERAVFRVLRSRLPTADRRPPTRDQRSETRDMRPETSDLRLETGDRRGETQAVVSKLTTDN
jgi:HAD superfamily phosphatase (TIGR01668 family)